MASSVKATVSRKNSVLFKESPQELRPKNIVTLMNEKQSISYASNS
jgi:hypothetical protein